MGQAEDAIRKLLCEHGKLLEVICEGNTIRMHFENAEVVGECSKGYFMQYGYSGTGPRYFWEFLNQAGFDLSYDQVTQLKAPVTLRPKWRIGIPKAQHPVLRDADSVHCATCGRLAQVRVFDPGKIALLGPQAMASMRRDNIAFRCQDCGYVVCFSCASSQTDPSGVPKCPSCGKEGGPYFFTITRDVEGTPRTSAGPAYSGSAHVRCTKCSAIFPIGDQECPSCSAKVESTPRTTAGTAHSGITHVRCTQCSAIFPIGDQECPSCSAKVVDVCRKYGKPLTKIRGYCRRILQIVRRV